MFLNNAFLRGRSGISRLMFTTAIILILCALSFSIAGAQGSGVLRVGMVEPVNLNPDSGSNDPEVLFNRTIYDYLLETRSDNTLAPSLASLKTLSLHSTVL
jgi:ABC-type oligopeptide transport system substrate-binding subunit